MILYYHVFVKTSLYLNNIFTYNRYFRMKVYPFKIPKTLKDTLIFQEDRELFFYNKLHQHEEIQLSFIERGTGNLLVMNTMTPYKAGDIFVIGSQTPHVYRSEPSGEVSVMLSIFFTPSCLGERFFDLPEMRPLHPFFESCERGFMATSLQSQIREYFYLFGQRKGPERIIVFLQLLQQLNTCKKQVLATHLVKKRYSEHEGKRISDVFTHTMNHYEKDISLREISDVANMSENAFCRYFKQHTNKTYFEFLKEIRVAKVCELLVKDQELTIAQIADSCGFKNISNFNRQFKSIKNTSPTNFRKEALKVLK